MAHDVVACREVESAGERRAEIVRRALEGFVLHASSSGAAYCTTSSTRDKIDWGIVRPSALAVLRLITSSNFVGCSTGRSTGLAPLRILSTKTAARRQMSLRSAP